MMLSGCRPSAPRSSANASATRQGPRRLAVRCAATSIPRNRGTQSTSGDNFYQLLGIESDASEDEVKAAYRRVAKELHPDVNQAEDANTAFMAAKKAYETLSDPDARRQYDISHSIHRLGFFRDVQEPAPAPPPFERRADPFEEHRRMWQGEPSGNPFRPDDDSEGQGASRTGTPQDPAEFLEQLQRFMGGGGAPMRSWQQGGGLDPWGTSSSESWHRRVQEQQSNPFGRGRPSYAQDGDRYGSGRPEWQPYRQEDDLLEKREGFRYRPGGVKWGPPRRGDEEEEGGDGGRDGRGGRGGRPGKGPSIGGDDFRRGMGL